MAGHRRWLAASRLLAGAVLLGALLAACDKPDAELNVVLEGWRNADYATRVCERARTWRQHNRDLIEQAGCEAVTFCPEMMVLVTRCAANPIGDLREFEDELLAQAAANAHCKRVRFVRVNERDNPDKTALPILQKPHWRLNIDYQPGASTQHWWMTDSPSRATYPKGEGNPKEIAADICSIVIERGAKLLN